MIATTRTEEALVVEEEGGTEMGPIIEGGLCTDVPTTRSPGNFSACSNSWTNLNRTRYGLRHFCLEMDVEAPNELERSDA